MTAGQPDIKTTGLPPAFPDRAAWGTATKLRAWQAAALTQYFETHPKDFLATATPGAGKTSFALTLAANLLDRRIIDRIIIVAPTEHLKTQWAEAAHKINIGIDPNFGVKQGKTSRDFAGIALTYAGVAQNTLGLRIRTEGFKTLVILDEVHHAGDALSWGEAVREAFEPATRRLMLTGTPFRSDANPIPFVTYEPEPRSRSSPTSRSPAAACGPSPTIPTGTGRRWPTRSSGRCSSWRTPATCTGGPAQATRSRPGSASR
ncbi:hypothetical protein GCM10028864_01940 [Microlunatus parietis]